MVGRIRERSPACGSRDWYWQAWAAGVSGGWYTPSVPCTRVRRLSPKFLRTEAATVPPSVFRSKYLCSFEDSGDALFLPSVLRRAQVLDDSTDVDQGEALSFAEFLRSEAA